ncbi:acyl carrier protein [Amycolatopsis sp.]|uniref:acyl carrier protein n=1 Tax=Amycolatopsis sp. TaxID=37632 RepID=UPI0039C88AE5
MRGHLAEVLGHDSPEAIGPTTEFRDLGSGSLTALEIRNQLAVSTGLRLPPTLVFEYPGARTLTGYLRQELLSSEVPTSGNVKVRDLGEGSVCRSGGWRFIGYRLARCATRCGEGGSAGQITVNSA